MNKQKRIIVGCLVLAQLLAVGSAQAMNNGVVSADVAAQAGLALSQAHSKAQTLKNLDTLANQQESRWKSCFRSNSQVNNQQLPVAHPVGVAAVADVKHVHGSTDARNELLARYRGVTAVTRLNQHVYDGSSLGRTQTRVVRDLDKALIDEGVQPKDVHPVYGSIEDLKNAHGLSSVASTSATAPRTMCGIWKGLELVECTPLIELKDGRVCLPNGDIHSVSRFTPLQWAAAKRKATISAVAVVAAGAALWACKRFAPKFFSKLPLVSRLFKRS